MVNINSLKINEFADKIEINVNTAQGNEINKALFWSIKTYKDVTKAIDISTKILKPVKPNEKVNEKVITSLTASEVNLKVFSGLFFIEFTSDEKASTTETVKDFNKATGVVSNFIDYHECLLEKALKIENIKNCKPVIDNCDNCGKNVHYLSTLINVLYTTIRSGFFEEAIKIMNVIEELCKPCETCTDYNNTRFINGTGFGTINNSIILL